MSTLIDFNDIEQLHDQDGRLIPAGMYKCQLHLKKVRPQDVPAFIFEIEVIEGKYLGWVMTHVMSFVRQDLRRTKMHLEVLAPELLKSAFDLRDECVHEALDGQECIAHIVPTRDPVTDEPTNKVTIFKGVN